MKWQFKTWSNGMYRPVNPAAQLVYFLFPLFSIEKLMCTQAHQNLILRLRQTLTSVIILLKIFACASIS